MHATAAEHVGGPFMTEGDILGHEPMGIVEEVGSAIENLAPGDRAVVKMLLNLGEASPAVP